ncbi:SIR2-domain-containing protein [Calocera cornea HHB12733]|uniref:SIR2-domain-containing protein n=1 Tax=Calocera cornea HHB12733 TaxID=1353952 RepID=A0A165HN45_9BASI|nr:SIR2-domain-containing protein [Calocera cornea HHB12733]
MGAFSEEEVEEMMQFLKERGMVAFLRKYIGEAGIPPSKLLLAFGVLLAPDLREQLTNEECLTVLRQAISRTLRDRERILQYETIDDAVRLIRDAKKILVLTGAGISVSCGIPDFRSTQGIYAQLRESEVGQALADPQQMFDLKFFKENPSVFYSFAHRIFPSNFKPSPCHYFIKLLEDKGKLLRNYTQNIDTLETVTGVKNVLNCHGSFATASCITCGTQYPGEEIRDDIFAERIPKCKVCLAKGRQSGKKQLNGKGKAKMQPWEEEVTDEDEYKSILKPDITFFGEKLNDKFDKALFEDREEVDLLLVIGTSLTVAPVSEILHHIPHSVPQILINKTPVPHVNPDIVILGEADEAVRYLAYRLGWELPIPDADTLKRQREDIPVGPQRIGRTWIWAFQSADGGEWLEDVKAGNIRRYMLASSDEESSDDEQEEEDGPAQHLRPPKESRDGDESDNSQASKRRRLA